MKKTLAVIMAVLMLVCCVPFTAGAADTNYLATNTFENDYTIGSNDVLLGNTIYKVAEGKTLTVPTGKTLYIPDGTSIKVLEGGKLVVYGSIITMTGSAVEVEGSVVGAGNITGEGSHTAYVTFPELSKFGLDGKIRVFYDCVDTVASPLSWKNKEIPASGAKIAVTLNKYFCVKVVICDPECDKAGYDITGTLNSKYVDESRYDNSLMNVYFNGVQIPYDQGCCRMTVSNAGEISYKRFSNENDFLKTVRILLPTGEGYEVIGRNGEMTEDGTVKLKWGQPFSFKVEIDDAYDMSNFKVYVYNGYGWLNVAGEEQISMNPDLITDGVPNLQPDVDGYYNIPGKNLRKDTTIHVIGVIKNETVTMIGNLLETFRSIFNMLKEFIESFLQMFNFGA